MSIKVFNTGFYPRSPCGERRTHMSPFNGNHQFLSTLSLRRATCFSVPNRLKVAVSIHALLAESDPLLMFWLFRLSWFLSTLSLRRATWGVRKAVGSLMGFYPRSPCGERRNSRQATVHTWKFLSTLSLRRATKLTAYQSGLLLGFYPRSPCGERRYSDVSCY